MKLIRDRVPQIIESEGLHARTHVACREELWGLLKEKLVEEALELLNANGLPEDPAEFEAAHAVEELADVFEVVEALERYVEARAPGKLAQVRAEKAQRKGRFDLALVLEGIEPQRG